MYSEAHAKPLDPFPAVRSSNAEEVEAGIIRTYGARRFNLSQRNAALNVHANHWQSPNIALSFCSYGADVQVDFPGAGFFRQQICLEGGSDNRVGGLERDLTLEKTYVVPPETPLRTHFSSNFEQLVLRVDAPALMKKLTAMIGEMPRKNLEFAADTRADGPLFQSLRRRVMFFIGELEASGAAMSPVALAELEQMLIVSFLGSNPNNYTALVEREEGRPAASWLVRRVEEYIEANWDRPITIEDLARVTSASARSIFYHFKRCRGHSPMEFVRQVRLDHARKMLTEGAKETSVTETAFACGFINLGHFAKDYHKRFGERPSATLKNTRGGFR